MILYTPTYNFPYPDNNATFDVPSDLKNLAIAIDSALKTRIETQFIQTTSASFTSGTLAATISGSNLHFDIPDYKGSAGDKGPKGDTGLKGLTGDKGPTGDTGATGAKGPKGDTGNTGAQGPQGASGTSPFVAGSTVLTTNSSGEGTVSCGKTITAAVITNGDFDAHDRAPHIKQINTTSFTFTNCDPNKSIRINWVAW